MHIAFLIDSLGSGGAQRQLVELACSLQGAGDTRVSVAVYHDHPFHAARLREAGVPLATLPRSGARDPRLALAIRRWLRAQAVDVLHAFLLTPAAWAALAVRGLPWRGRPALVAAERSALVARGGGFAHLQRIVYRTCDAVTANSRSAARDIRERLGVPAGRVHYVPNGIDLEAWDRAAKEPCPLALEPGRLHFAMVGGLRPEKDHAFLFEAMARIPRSERASWTLWCVGEGTAGAEAADRVFGRARELGLDDCVRFAAPVRNVAALLREMAFLVLPSRYEGFPNAVLEAMASGIPVVATPVGDVPAMVEDGRTGLLVPQRDAGALAAALRRLEALGEAGRQELGRRGRSRVEERYRMPLVAETYRGIYEALRRRREGDVG